jgi:hypothetical protein
MTNAVANPFFHVSLGDRDDWVIEAEWPDGTLEQVTSFWTHSAAAHWIATASKTWLHASDKLKIGHGTEAVATLCA